MKLKTAIAAAMLAALLAPAAGARAAEVTGGLKTGMNISDLVGADAGGDKSSKAGFAFGGYLIFPLRTASFRIQTECLYTEKGAVYKGDVLGSHFESRLKLAYLEIPVLARFDIESKSGAKPAFLIGPSFGIKIGARAESHAIGWSNSGNIDNVRSIDPGVVVGGTVDIPAGRGAITLDARYTRGLATVYESNGGNTASIFNSVISIMLGYRF